MSKRSAIRAARRCARHPMVFACIAGGVLSAGLLVTPAVATLSAGADVEVRMDVNDQIGDVLLQERLRAGMAPASAGTPITSPQARLGPGEPAARRQTVRLAAVSPHHQAARMGQMDAAAALLADEGMRGVSGFGTAVPGILNAATLSAMPPAEGDDAWRCLTQALYFEARGESPNGQIAVAEVILNRVDSPRYPDTVCDVVSQGGTELHRCQFSYMCDGRSEDMDEVAARVAVGKVAHVMLDGAPRTLTGGAMFYHTTAVEPGWSRRLTRTAQIGAHLFYTRPQRQARN